MDWSFQCRYNVTGVVSSNLKGGSTDKSVERVSNSWSQGRGFDPILEHGVVSLSKTLHSHCLVLVKPRKSFLND